LDYAGYKETLATCQGVCVIYQSISPS